MDSPQFPSHESQLAQHQEMVKDILDFLGRKHFLSAEEKEEFCSEAYIKLLENDGEVFSKHKGDATLKTYLSVVLSRLLLDLRDKAWGRWRPSSAAKRLGSLAILLEQHTHRDGMTFEETYQHLVQNTQIEVSKADLWQLYEQLPHRYRRQHVGEDALEPHASGDVSPLEMLEREDHTLILAKATAAVQECLLELPQEERLILRLHYAKNLPLSKIARTLGCEQKPLYRSLHQILLRLKKLLAARNIRADAIESLIR